MPTDPFHLSLLLTGALLAGVLSAVAGFGGGVLYLPLVVAVVGARAAVPLITFGLLFSNFTRLVILRRHIVWPLTLRYCIGAIPGAALGAFVFVHLPSTYVTKGIGGFLIVSVIFSRWQKNRPVLTRWGIFYPLGAIVGFFSTILGVIGPAAMPLFLAAGLRKEAFVATVALGAFVMHLTGTITYGQFNLLSGPLMSTGLLIGALMAIGTWVGTLILTRATPKAFLNLVEVLLVILGVFFIFR
ncbi:MAG: sulfite exporter TauE/SafE family protein [candidate division Zixibacteria bacterium]|nr:sulfite exporter TauE/SafE family protein [candidate division Zixibacteria bacterium]